MWTLFSWTSRAWRGTESLYYIHVILKYMAAGLLKCSDSAPFRRPLSQSLVFLPCSARFHSQPVLHSGLPWPRDLAGQFWSSQTLGSSRPFQPCCESLAVTALDSAKRFPLSAAPLTLTLHAFQWSLGFFLFSRPSKAHCILGIACHLILSFSWVFNFAIELLCSYLVVLRDRKW